MSTKKDAAPTSEVGFDLKDYRDAFMAALTGMVQRSGLQMADEGHYLAMANNIDGFAVQAARTLRQRRLSHLAPDTGGTL